MTTAHGPALPRLVIPCAPPRESSAVPSPQGPATGQTPHQRKRNIGSKAVLDPDSGVGRKHAGSRLGRPRQTRCDWDEQGSLRCRGVAEGQVQRQPGSGVAFPHGGGRGACTQLPTGNPGLSCDNLKEHDPHPLEWTRERGSRKGPRPTPAPLPPGTPRSSVHG